MPIVEIIVQLIIEIGRTAIVEELSERIRRIQIHRFRRMDEVRRHIHHRTSRRFLNRLSTGPRGKRALP